MRQAAPLYGELAVLDPAGYDGHWTRVVSLAWGVAWRRSTPAFVACVSLSLCGTYWRGQIRRHDRYADGLEVGFALHYRFVDDTSARAAIDAVAERVTMLLEALDRCRLAS